MSGSHPAPGLTVGRHRGLASAFVRGLGAEGDRTHPGIIARLWGGTCAFADADLRGPPAATDAAGPARDRRFKGGYVLRRETEGTVLTLGSGGVSLFALQFAKAAGATVVATSGSEKKAERLRQLGADTVVDHRAKGAWPTEVLELTDGRGVDHVIEVVGRLEPSVQALAMEGEIAFVGMVERAAGLPPISPQFLWAKGLTLRMIAVGSRAHFEQMNRAIEVNRLRPVIDRVFGFDVCGRASCQLALLQRAAGQAA